VTLPPTSLVHNGHEEQRIVEGTSARVRFTSERPVAGLALVAGRYQRHAREDGDHRYQLFLPPGSDLDPEKVLESMVVAERGLAEHFGPSGFGRATLYVPRRLPRAFNDGSGLLGIPPRYFHDGRYGYETVAHELAHNWWGATVAEKWLAPGTGGEWIVEGFAQYSSWRAVGERFGQPAFVRALRRNFFDPDATGALAATSVVDNGLDPQARATIYQKGGYVTYLLAQQLGADGFDAAARAFIEKYRYQAADDAAVQEVFAATSQQDLAPFFAAWVRSTASIDLALEPREGSAAVRNLRGAPAPERIALWRNGSAEPEHATTAVGETVADVGAQRLLLDPLAAVADMFRSNNVLPRVDTPRLVEVSPHGDVLVVDGEPVAWEPASVRIVSSAGKTLHSWRSIAASPPSRRGAPTAPASRSKARGRTADVAGAAPRRWRAADARSRPHRRRDGDGTVVASAGRLIRLGKGRGQMRIAHHEGRIGALLPAPNGGGIAYALARGQEMELRLLPAGAAESRVLFTWAACAPLWAWAPDGTRLFVALPGDWDWQLWELPVDGSEPRRLVHEAARITGVTAAPDSNRVASSPRTKWTNPTIAPRSSSSTPAPATSAASTSRRSPSSTPPGSTTTPSPSSPPTPPIRRCREARRLEKLPSPTARERRGEHRNHGTTDRTDRSRAIRGSVVRLRALAFARDAERRARREIADLAGEEVDDVVDDVAHRHDTGRVAVGVDQRDVAEAAVAHQVERVGDAVLQGQALRIAGHRLADRRGVDVAAGGDHLPQHVALGEDADEQGAVAHRDRTDAFLEHPADRLLHGRLGRHAHRPSVGSALTGRAVIAAPSQAASTARSSAMHSSS
jgi:hypothetical protein